ncbi:MAG: hypothetical protein JWM11_189 [Planctomycetaceae bacterium]|nr:hypothetical protein [Planctomycetaceae bacterium]
MVILGFMIEQFDFATVCHVILESTRRVSLSLKSLGFTPNVRHGLSELRHPVHLELQIVSRLVLNRIMLHFQRLLRCLLLLCLFGIAVEAVAQTSLESGTPPAGSAGSPGSAARPLKEGAGSKSEKEGTTEISADLVQVKNAHGESILVPRKVWNDVLSELEARMNLRPAEPQTSVTRVALEGSSDGETVTLKATLTIQLLVDGKWIKVPLKLNEGLLQDQSYAGAGEATSGGFDPTLGYLWWLKGKGQHVLTLTLNVPLRKEQPSRRLQLSLPQTAVSDLKLRVQMPRITAKVDEQNRARLVVTPTSDGATLIEMVLGLGAPGLDVRWQPQPELGSVETVLQAQTSISAVVDGRTLSLDATQKVVALQGSFNQVQVRLPPGAELLQVKGDHFKDFTIDPKDPSLVLVTFKETVSDTSTPVELKWKIRIELPQQLDRLMLQGFDVAKAKLQTGYLAVKVVGDFRLEVADDASHFAHRANLSSLEEAQPSFSSLDDVSSAYGFTRQPFQLALHLRPEKPLVTIKPRLFLSLTNDRMELFGEYDVQFYRGRIDEVKFAWPGWKEEGWKIDPVTSGNGVQDTALDDPSVVSVKLLSRDPAAALRPGDKSGPNSKVFTLSLHASRPITTGQANQEFSLPGIPDANVQPADFVLVLADNLDADLRPLSDTVPRLQAVPLANSVPLPKPLENLRRRDFRLDAPRPRFSLSTTVQKQRISTSADVEISLEGSEVKLIQRINYDVAYERLSQLLFLVPEAWGDRVQFAVSVEGKETPLVPIETGAAEGIRKQKRLVLDSPRIGRFDVIVTAKMTLAIPPGLASKNLEVPLVQTSDSEFASTRIRIHKPKRQRLTVIGDGWTPQTPQGGASVWVAVTKQSALILQCDQSDSSWRQGVAVPRRLVQAVFSPDGDVFCQVQYRFAGYIPVLRLTFPQGSKSPSARWMQVPKDHDISTQSTELTVSSTSRRDLMPARQDLQLIETPGVAGQFEFALPEIEADAEHLVTVTYQLPRQPRPGFGAYRHLDVPELRTDGTPTQTFWQIQLLDNQHLWTLPAGFIPEFDWQMQSWWWSRVPRQSSRSLRHWIGEPVEPKFESDLSSNGNRYVFSSLDASTSMSFRTLSSPMIVLIGASMALVFGFVLFNVPSLRHVLTFLWLGFLTTFTALWYSEPVLVLLQPVCLGLGLAVLAALAQRWRTKSRRVEPVVTLGTPSDILAAASSDQHASPPGTGKMIEPSESRPPAIVLPEAGVGI